MSYQFVKTLMTEQGEVAYLLDTKRGVVIKVPVEDHVGGFAGTEVDEDIVPVPYVPRRPVRVPQPIDIAQPENFQEPAPPTQQRSRPRSIMPPELRGVFIKPGKPGADTEHREA